MPETANRLIEEWFSKHSDDGEFIRLGREVPYSVIGHPYHAGRVLFTTKPDVVLTGLSPIPGAPLLGAIGRRGLPDEQDLSWLRAVIGSRGLYFLGDMDPADLLVFVWLRECLRPAQIEFLGVGDALCRKLQIHPSNNWMICLSDSEMQARSLVHRFLPELEVTVGADFAKVLADGRKVEIEAIVSATGSAAPIIAAACQ